MDVLHRLSPLVEPLSLDEAFVDLRAATTEVDFSRTGLELLIGQLKDEVRATTDGLTASVGIGNVEVRRQGGQRAGQAGRQLHR